MDQSHSAGSVKDRLLGNGKVTMVPAPGFELFLCRDFLPPEDCEALIQRIDATREPSRIVGEVPDSDYRTSETCNLDPHTPLTGRIETRIAALTGIDPSFGETIQGQRYGPGQQFKAHHDYFNVGRAHWDEQERMGGQRTWTVMIFLNAPQAGGQTFFPHAKLRISPKPGNLLAWNNLNPDGSGNAHSLHQGLPVEAGAKYIITKWYRERRWGYSAP